MDILECSASQSVPSPMTPQKTFIRCPDMKRGTAWWRRVGAAVAMFAVGLGPTIFIMVAFNYKSLSGSSALIIFFLTSLCTVIAYFISHTYFRPPTPQHAALTQTEDVEGGQGGDAQEDAPPIYDAVVTKPPPYESLYEINFTSFCEKDEAKTDQPIGDICTDYDLPTYSQAAQTPTPV